MKSYDRECHRLALHFLLDYRLSVEERKDEADRLAYAIQKAVESELESLEHRAGGTNG